MCRNSFHCKGKGTFFFSYLFSKRSLDFVFWLSSTAWKVSKYGVISGSYFPVFELNTEIYEINLHIWSEYRKVRTRNNSVFRHFSRTVHYSEVADFFEYGGAKPKHSSASTATFNRTWKSILTKKLIQCKFLIA